MHRRSCKSMNNCSVFYQSNVGRDFIAHGYCEQSARARAEVWCMRPNKSVNNCSVFYQRNVGRDSWPLLPIDTASNRHVLEPRSGAWGQIKVYNCSVFYQSNVGRDSWPLLPIDTASNRHVLESRSGAWGQVGTCSRLIFRITYIETVLKCTYAYKGKHMLIQSLSRWRSLSAAHWTLRTPADPVSCIQGSSHGTVGCVWSPLYPTNQETPLVLVCWELLSFFPDEWTAKRVVYANLFTESNTMIAF